jgi:hypothetical protein
MSNGTLPKDRSIPSHPAIQEEILDRCQVCDEFIIGDRITCGRMRCREIWLDTVLNRVRVDTAEAATLERMAEEWE